MATKDKAEAHIIGRAGRNPEVRYTASGKTVVTFSLATGGGKKKDGSGNWPTYWWNITSWDAAVADVVTKGALIEVHGYMQMDEWEKDGQKRTALKITATSVELPDGEAIPQGEITRQAPAPRTQNYQTQEITDDDIPF